MKTELTDLLVELAKLRLQVAYQRLRRSVLARVAETLPTELLDDVRLAATEELGLRGLHVIAQRPRSRKVA